MALHSFFAVTTAVCLSVFALASCAPTIQEAMRPPETFQGPRFEEHKFVSFDGAQLGLTVYKAEGPPVDEGVTVASDTASTPPAGGGPEPEKSDLQQGAEAVMHALFPPPKNYVEPWAVIIALHGMNDYAEAFYLAGPYWAKQGVTTYAYDARGFGRSPNRGVWAGEYLMVEDLRTAVALARKRHPKALIAVVGESMGAAQTMVAFSKKDAPDADRVVLAAPAVWGWSALPMLYSATLWATAHGVPGLKVTPPRGVAPTPSDNNEMLRKVGRDKNMLFDTRVDAVYGLVNLMEDAADSAGKLKAPTIFLYGQKDQIIPRDAALTAASRLPAGARTAYYPQSYHMMLRDLNARIVWDDVLAFIRDPKAPLPSGAGPIPKKKR
jgi:alpha-beta hydrolase superfamily lysophospholipase